MTEDFCEVSLSPLLTSRRPYLYRSKWCLLVANLQQILAECTSYFSGQALKKGKKENYNIIIKGLIRKLILKIITQTLWQSLDVLPRRELELGAVEAVPERDEEFSPALESSIEFKDERLKKLL